MLARAAAARLRVAVAQLRALRRPASDTPGPKDEPAPELAVGQLEGVDFQLAPLPRSGESPATKRARLLCISPPLLLRPMRD